MAMLDVSEAIVDPDFLDSFTVYRRAETVGTNGRSTTTTTSYQGILGVVTPVSPNQLERAADYQNMKRTIKVTTTFALRGEVTGFQPDIVFWRGDNYLVRAVDNLPQFGAGFFRAECTSMDKTDVPLDKVSQAQLVYTKAGNPLMPSLL